MKELSYSFHLGNDKNKTKVVRKTAKNNSTSTTSFSNNAIQNITQLTKADKHNLRKYDNNQELIETVIGSNSISNDVKDLYYDLFNKAKENYNDKQTRNDRKIDDYFEHIANDNKHDLACEIIIELGDMNYWNNIDKNDKRKMIQVYKEQCFDLEEIVPNFKIANATIYFDESSPHLHIIGIPFKDGIKNGMSIQVGKAAIFTKESLIKIQDQMRQKCIKSFNKVYGFNYNLKEKELGRNKDINVKNMINYSNVKKDIQKNKNELDKLNNNANNIKEKSVEIEKTLSELKTLPLNKSNYSISKTDVDKLKKYIEETKESSNHMLNTNNIANIMNEYEKDLKEHKKEVKELNSIINNQQKDYDNLDFHYSMLVNENNDLKKENNYLSKVIDKLNNTIERISNFVYKLFYKGYIPKKDMAQIEEEGTLFRKDKDTKKDDFEL